MTMMTGQGQGSFNKKAAFFFVDFYKKQFIKSEKKEEGVFERWTLGSGYFVNRKSD